MTQALSEAQDLAPDFAPDYASARAAFLDAAAAAGATLESRPHPGLGLQGEALSLDLAWLGPRQASRVLLSLSGTHGVEGLYGSGCQVAFLRQQAGHSLPPDTAVLLLHALNPHGFSWLRRVNEDNIDINRNYIDFRADLPENEAYNEVHPWLLPQQWTPETCAVLQAQVQGYMQRVGPQAAARALSGGQYQHADGIFYGGRALCWSNQQLAAVAHSHLQQARSLCVLDHHTGLGPSGHTELICRHPPDSRALGLARQWWGGDVTSPASGESASAVIDGNVRMALRALCPQALVVAVALEVGTQAQQQVMFSLFADNWLHQRGDPLSAQGTKIRQQVRDAFFVDTPAWRAVSLTRALEIYQQGLKGMQALQAAA
jgi:hypothetical protein